MDRAVQPRGAHPFLQGHRARSQICRSLWAGGPLLFAAQGRWLIVDLARETAEAARLARHAVEFGSDDAVALCTAGVAQAYLVGGLEGGNALTELALAQNPNFAWAWVCSGWVKLWRGEIEAAMERLTHAIRLSPN